MSMRISDRMMRAGLLCLALAACDGASGYSGHRVADHGSEKPAVAVDCAVGANARWSRNCSVDRQGDRLTFRHADGGFRRFHILKDGRGLMAADGAERANLSIIGKGQVEIRVGDDRYRTPATIAAVNRP